MTAKEAQAKETPAKETPAEKAKTEGYGKLFGLLKPYKWTVTTMVAMGLFGVVLEAFGPLLLGRATDRIFAGAIGPSLPAGVDRETLIEQYRAEGRDVFASVLSTVDVVPGEGMNYDLITEILFTALVVYVIAAVVKLGQDRLAAKAVQLAMADLRRQVQDKLSRLPLSHFDKASRGDMVSRVTNDVDNVQQTLQHALSQLVTAPLAVTAVLVLMFWLSPLLAVVVLVSVPLSGILVTFIVIKSQPIFDRTWAATGNLTAHVEEAYTGHGLIKVFHRRNDAVRAFDHDNDNLREVSARANFLSAVIEPTMMFVAALSYIAVTVIGALRIAGGHLSLGDMQAFIQYTNQFSQPLAQLSNASGQLQSGVSSANRIFELLGAAEQEPDPERPDRPIVVQGQVAFRDVSFRYVPDRPLIENFNLTVRPGSTVAVVGPTGAGKSTLGNLLMRFYDPDSGSITLDGVDVTRMSRHELRARSGMVLQDTWLFAGTIADNIAYGRAGATREDVIEAAKATHVDEFIRTLPDGYDTVLDEEANGISAGEKQLLTLARAFIAKPALLLLDEATSSVDTRTEVLVQRGMTALREGRTTFVIAHRLSTVRNADVILVMKDGAVVEQGSHEELMFRGGVYSALVRAQYANQPAPVIVEEPEQQPAAVVRGMRFLTISEVATLMNEQRSTVYTLVQTGGLGAIRVGRSWRVPSHEVENYLEQDAR